MTFLTLDSRATLVSLALGILLILLGGRLGAFFFIVMLYFLVISAIVTWIGTPYKKKRQLYEKSRGMKNVVANSAIPLVMAIAFFVSTMFFAGLEQLIVFGFIGSVAAVAADKFSSELGVLDGDPIMIFTFKKVRKGVSGGVTWFGLLMGIFGAFMISLSAALLVGGFFAPGLWYLVIGIVLSGFIGTVADSVAGYFETNGIGNKFTSNAIASIAGALAAMAIFAILIT